MGASGAHCGGASPPAGCQLDFAARARRRAACRCDPRLRKPAPTRKQDSDTAETARTNATSIRLLMKQRPTFASPTKYAGEPLARRGSKDQNRKTFSLLDLSGNSRLISAIAHVNFFCNVLLKTLSSGRSCSLLSGVQTVRLSSESVTKCAKCAEITDNSAGHSAALGRSSKSYQSVAKQCHAQTSITNERRGKRFAAEFAVIGSDRQCSALVALRMHYDC